MKHKTPLFIALTSIISSLSLMGGTVLGFTIHKKSANKLPTTQIVKAAGQNSVVSMNDVQET
jgi:hypothetical protein